MNAPETITHQDKLLTIDTNVGKFLKGLLHPGISVYPLFLDPYNGVWVLRNRLMNSAAPCTGWPSCTSTPSMSVSHAWICLRSLMWPAA